MPTLLSGFTLLEVLVVLSLFGVMAGFALPHLSSLNKAFKHLNAQSYFLQDLKRAQAESITQGCRGVVVITSDGHNYTFGCDYLTYDTNNPPAHDVTSLRRKLPEHIKIQVTAPIIFNSRGQAVDVNDIVSNLTVSLIDTSEGLQTFATGTLLGTGVFSFD